MRKASINIKKAMPQNAIPRHIGLVMMKADASRGLSFIEKLREQELIKFLFDRLDLYRDMMARPYVAGKDLIDRGIMPGDDFGTILEYAHKLRLAGVSKDDALKQTLSYARKLRKNIK